MAIEAGARAGMISVDETTLNYVRGTPFSPKGDLWHKANDYWKTLHSDDNAVFDKTLEIDATEINPMVTWGTSPDMVIDVDGSIPYSKNGSVKPALDYMGLSLIHI